MAPPELLILSRVSYIVYHMVTYWILHNSSITISRLTVQKPKNLQRQTKKCKSSMLSFDQYIKARLGDGLVTIKRFGVDNKIILDFRVNIMNYLINKVKLFITRRYPMLNLNTRCMTSTLTLILVCKGSRVYFPFF